MTYRKGQDEPIPEQAPSQTGGTVCLLLVVALASLICVLLVLVW